MTPGASRFWRVWRAPLTIAGLTLFGLLSALLGDHRAWRVVSWAALLTPLLAILRHWPLRRVLSRKRER